ncbi:MAG: hypothetical protein V4509_01865 [Patescibacteria group bacterium]
MSEPNPVSLISLDPAAAARSIATVVAEANGERDWLEEKVTIQFYNIEEPGADGFFCFGLCTNPKRIEVKHGEIVEMNRGDVRYIESRQTPMYSYKSGPDGKMRKTLMGWKPRFQCRQVNSKPRAI